ncbi:MAG: hypothetical protein FJ088_03140 [Deltaproteobacteria bacterium]|nr:hypothetical protein [Deltaproteobacteria bacterium]
MFRRLLLLSFAVLAGVSQARAEVLPSDMIVIEDTDGSINKAQSVLPDFYLQKAACAAYKKHPDNYDVMFVFTTIPQGIFTGTPAAATVQQTQKGIGKPLVNSSFGYCSTRLKHAVRMGDIAKLPDDPENPYTAVADKAVTGVQVMAHEFGHHWMSYVAYDKGDGTGKHCRLRAFVGNAESGSGDCDGYPPSAFGVHWSAYFNSNSVMYGNQIKDNNDGTFTLGNDGKLKFGPLDQYPLGLRYPEEVGPLFLLDLGGVTAGESSAYPLQIGTTKTVKAERIDVAVEDVVRAEGDRIPAIDPCHWKGAVVLVFATGKPPTANVIFKLTDYANSFEKFYEWATDGRGSADMTADGRGKGTSGCPSGDEQPPEADEIVEEVMLAEFQDAAAEEPLTAEKDYEEISQIADVKDVYSPDDAAETGTQAGGGCGVGVRTESAWLLIIVLAAVLRKARQRIV